MQTISCRERLSFSYLKGKGCEFGALHNPLATDVNLTKVMYADKFDNETLSGMFQELGEHLGSIVQTDIYLDLNKDNLQKLVEHDFDFFIANHVIEHLVNPLQFLQNLSDVMKSGSILYLSIPDKDYTFDKNRELTSWEHLYEEYQKKITKLSNAHLKEFIFSVCGDPKELAKQYWLPWKRKKMHDIHRQRSIHVHVWDSQSFNSFLTKGIAELNLNFEILDSVNGLQTNHESIYILQKA